MYVLVYVIMYVCMYAGMHACMHVHTHSLSYLPSYLHTDMHAYRQACAQTCMRTDIQGISRNRTTNHSVCLRLDVLLERIQLGGSEALLYSNPPEPIHMKTERLD